MMHKFIILHGIAQVPQCTLCKDTHNLWWPSSYRMFQTLEGYDETPTSLVIDCKEELAEPLSYLINHRSAHSVFPAVEKCTKITPAHKSDENAVMDNYHPISLLPVKSKFLRELCIVSFIHVSKETAFLLITSLDFIENHLLRMQLHIFLTSYETAWIKEKQ